MYHRSSGALFGVTMEEADGPREVGSNETRPRIVRGSNAPSIRSKAKDLGMFISVPKQQSPAQQLLHEHRMNSNSEWLGGGGGGAQAALSSGPITASVSHNTVGGLMLHREPVSTPTRRISAASGLQSRLAARRTALNRPRVESRFGKAHKNLSKTVHPMPLLGQQQQQRHLQQQQQQQEPTQSTDTKSLQSIATQTNEADDVTADGAGMMEASRRFSRIPVPQEKMTVVPREKTPVPVVSSLRNTAATESYSRYSLSNVYSLMTISLSQTKLEEIRSSSAISVSVRPVIEAHESCTVVDVDILRLGMVRSKEVDIDRTLENWKPTTAEVSLVSDEKPAKTRTKKSIVKKEKSREESRAARKAATAAEQQRPSPPPSFQDKVAVIDLDKEAFTVPGSGGPKLRGLIDKRSSRRDQGNTDPASTNRAEEKAVPERHPDSPGSGSGSNFRVRFSPQLTTPAASAASSRGKFSTMSGKTLANSPTSSLSSIPARYPEIVRRVTDQAITSIAKSVFLGLPAPSLSQKLPRYEPLPASLSFSSYRLAGSSPSYASTYHRSFQNYPRMPPPMTMSSMNVMDDAGSYRYPSRNVSQMSVASATNYPSVTGSYVGGLHGAATGGRYGPYGSLHGRIMSTHSIPKSRKEFDNRYSLQHFHSQSGIWDSAGGTAAPSSWVRNSTSAYNMHSGEYGPRAWGSGASSYGEYGPRMMGLGASSSGEYGPRMMGSGASGTSQLWLRYQRMKNRQNQNGSYSTTSSSSSLYLPNAKPKYERPSQRFSLIRSHGGAMRPSVENLHGSSVSTKKSTDSHGSIHHRPMESSMDERPGISQYKHDPYM